MRSSIAVPVLLSVFLILVAGCAGGEEPSTQEESAPKETKAPEETTSKTTAPAPEAGTPETTLEISNALGEVVPVRVEVADTDTEKRRGLMERTELAEDAGILFVFGGEQQVPFTMRNTQLPLSIAFINAQGIIVDILDMQPLDETTPYASAAPYQYALEVNQGFFAQRGIEVGNLVELPLLFDPAGTSGSAEVVQAFQDAGLEVGESYPVEEETGWEERPIPKTYTEATRFTLPSLGEDAGGRVFVFSTEEDLAAVRGYYEGLDNSLRPYLYAEGNVLLQLTNQLPEAEAERYRAAL